MKFTEQDKRESTKNPDEMVRLHYAVIAPLIMAEGVGDGKTTSCVMAQAATIYALSQGKTLDKPTDKLECACPILRRMAISANDVKWWASNEERTEHLRPLIPLLINSKVPREVMWKRAFYTVDKSIREITPMRIEFAAQFRKESLKEKMLGRAGEFRAIPEIANKKSCKVARDLIAPIKKAADVDVDTAEAAALYVASYAYAYAYKDAYTYTYTYKDAYADAAAAAKRKSKSKSYSTARSTYKCSVM